MSGGGGLLNLIATGNQNVILFGNPSKTFFKAKYAKHTNFGMQKFRLDYNGLRNMHLREESHFEFKIKRYGDLLMDTYVVVNLPHIWSPIYPPKSETGEWVGYNFKWIENIGSEMIKEVSISVGGQVLQRFNGSYIKNVMNRDNSLEKLEIFNKMTGNVKDINDPANAHSRIGNYPSAYYTGSSQGAQPSIMGRKLYIPIPFWFSNSSKIAFPLVALQYNELVVNLTLRPVYELYRIRNIEDENKLYPYIQPKLSSNNMQFYRFLHTPPSLNLDDDDYNDKSVEWNADVHLVATYAFLSDEEREKFAKDTHDYLFKDVQIYNFYNITGSKNIKLETNGLISNWMFHLQRSDVSLRNEWSNYTNWPYNGIIPQNVILAPQIDTYRFEGYANIYNNNEDLSGGIGAGTNPTGDTGVPTYLTYTGDFNPENNENILHEFGIKIDGNYRENKMERGIFEYIEPYRSSRGPSDNGIYYYNFSINSDNREYQPSGAINLNKFKNIELEFTTYVPPLDPNAEVLTICDNDGNVIGINKSEWNIYKYNYNLTLYEEKYNIIHISSGNCGLMFSR